MLPLDQLALNLPAATKPRVVVVGGGFGAINLLKSLPADQFQVVLLSKLNYYGFWPLLYQVATAGLEPESIGEPIRQLFDERPDVLFRGVCVTGFDPAAKTVQTPIGSLPYDYLVLATGTRSNYFGNQEIAQHSFGLKDLADAVKLRSHLLHCFELASLAQDPAQRQRLLNFVIAGGGPTGVELAGSLAEMRQHILPRDYPSLDFQQMHIYLVEGEDRVLPPMSAAASRHAQQFLVEKGVELKLKQLVAAYDGQTVKLKDGEEIPAQTLVWAAGVTGATLDGLPADKVEHGRYLVNKYNQIIGFQDVFAIGDVALMKTADYPKGHPQVAPPAIQQGTHLAKNLLHQLRGEVWEPFHYFDKGTLAIMGRGRAVADLPGGLHLHGLPAFMTWLLVHIYYLSGFRNKLIVTANWAYRLFSRQRGTRVLVQPYTGHDDPASPELTCEEG